MGLISVRSVANRADTTEQGLAVRAAIVRALHRDGDASVSFEDIDNATSSFVNAAVLPLLDIMTVSELQKRVRFVNSNRQINDMIRHCVGRYRKSSDLQAAAI